MIAECFLEFGPCAEVRTAWHCEGGFLAFTRPFCGTGSSFEICEGGDDFLCLGIEYSTIQVVVCFKGGPKVLGIVCFAVEGVWCCTERSGRHGVSYWGDLDWGSLDW